LYSGAIVKFTLPLISDDTPLKLPTVLVCVTSGPSPTIFLHEGKLNIAAANITTVTNFFIDFNF
jgi:hypothetical protein